MIKISYWGKRNPKTTRFIIAICHIVLMTISVWIGLNMFVLEYEVPGWLIPVVVSLFALLYLSYPQKRDDFLSYWISYRRRKAVELGLVVFQSVVLALGIHQILTNDYTNSSPESVEVLTMAIYNPVFPKSQMDTFSMDQYLIKKIKSIQLAVKQELKSKKWFQITNVDERSDNSKKGWLIFLTVFLIIIATGGIAMLSCSLSCSGNEGLAIVVLLGGMTGIIWGSISAFRSIHRKYKKVT